MQKTFGEYIRHLRSNHKMPLRKLAALLDIDQSTLSKIERNERKAVSNMIPVLAKTFSLDYKEMKIRFLSDNIVAYLNEEDFSTEVLKVAEQKIECHYQNFIDLVSQVKHDHPRPDLPTANTLSLSWHTLCAAAYFADWLGHKPVSQNLLKKAESVRTHDRHIAPSPWRLWLFNKTHMGSRNVAFVLSRPEFTLAEMRDWAEQNWTAFKPKITYNNTENGERLILTWEEFAVDFVMYDSPKLAQNFVSYFKKKNLGKFQIEGARALRWKDAGDYDAVDAINTSIEILDYFKSHPHIAVNIG